MKYYITMERRLRYDVEFEADNDADAESKADAIYYETVDDPENFEIGFVEYDYALSDEEGRTVLDWSK